VWYCPQTFYRKKRGWNWKYIIIFNIDSNGRLTTTLYDKRDDFDYAIVNFPFLCSNIPLSPAYAVYISQLILYARAYWPWRWVIPLGVYLNKGARRVRPVSRGCLLLGTWSYLCICRRSVLPYTRFCNWLLDYDYVLHIVNFANLYWYIFSNSDEHTCFVN
jgi:hypothetical protein